MAKGDGQGGGASDIDDPSLLDEGDGLDGGEGSDGGGDGGDGHDGGDAQHREADQQGKRDEGVEDLEIVIEDGAEGADGEGALADGGDDSGAVQDDRSNYSRDVRARIAREQRIAREARSRAETERAARIKAEHESFAAQKDALEITEAALESQIKSTKASLVKAKDDGKTEEEVELQASLNALVNRKGSVESAKKQLEARVEQAKKGAEAGAPNMLAEQWKRRNPWYGNQRYREQTLVTQAIDQQLDSEGYDKTSSEYFAELDRRVRRRLPELQRFFRGGGNGGGDGQGQRRNGGGVQQQQRRDPAGPVRRSAEGGAQARPGRIVLTRSDFQTMRTYGMDPTDKVAQKEYALNKMKGTGNG